MRQERLQTDFSMFLLAIVAGAMVCASAAAEGPIRLEDPIPLDPYFKPVSLNDFDLDSPAHVMGDRQLNPAIVVGDRLLPNDLIFAMDGYRVFSRVEMEYLRLIRGNIDSRGVELIVQRREKDNSRKNLELHITAPLVGRKLGVSLSLNPRVRDTLVKNKYPLPVELGPSLTGMTMRANFALAVYMKQHPDDKRLVWMDDFLEVYGHIVNQEWDQVRQPERPLPVPYYAKLVDFYVSIAQRHLEGEQWPDWEAHNVDYDYFVFNYPFPRFVPPPLGESEWSSEFLWKQLVRYRSSPWNILLPPQEAQYLIDPKRDALQDDMSSDYIYIVGRALTSPFRHGAEPFNYSENFSISDPQDRARLLKQLTDKVKQKDQDETLFAAAMVTPLVLDGNGEKTTRVLDFIRKRSPYVGFVALKLAYRTAAHVYNSTGEADAYAVVQQLLKYEDEHPFQLTPKSSKCLEFLRARDRGLRFSGPLAWNHAPDYYMSFYYPLNHAHAWRRKEPLDVLFAQLDEKINRDDFAQHRKELLQEARELTVPFADPADIERLARLGRDGRGHGLILKTCAAILRGNYAFEGGHKLLFTAVCDHLINGLFAESPQHNDTGYAAVSQLLGSLDRSNPAAARETLLAAFEEHGKPAATLLIAKELSELGFEEDGEQLQHLVTNFALLNFQRYLSSHNAQNVFPVLFAQMSIEPKLGKFTAGWTHNLMQQRAANYGREPALFLIQARCQLNEGNLADAISMLRDSFQQAEPKSVAPLYLYDGKVDTSTENYRRWLLAQIRKHADFNDEIERHLDASQILDKIPAAPKGN